MGKREQIIDWFGRLDESEREAVLERLTIAESAQLEAILGGAADTATAQASDLNAAHDKAARVKRQLIGAPAVFLRLHNGEETSEVPPKLLEAARAELERLKADPSVGARVETHETNRRWPAAGLFDTAKNVWHRLSRTFS